MDKPLFTIINYIVPFGSSSDTDVWYEVQAPNKATIPMDSNLVKLLIKNGLTSNPNVIPHELLKTARFTWPRDAIEIPTKTPYVFMKEFLGMKILVQIYKLARMEHMDNTTLSMLSIDTFIRYIQGVTVGKGVADRGRTIQLYFSIYSEAKRANGVITGETLFKFTTSLINYICTTYQDVTVNEARKIAEVYAEPLFLLHQDTLEASNKAEKSRAARPKRIDTEED